MLKIYHFAQEQDALRQQLSRTVSFDPESSRTVDDILHRVRTEGDEALLDLTHRFQGVRLDDLKVSASDIEEAYATADPEFIAILEEAYRN
ncbi:MAG: histidinol dehydrogenase, partial [Chlorobiaceae bacterium]|nr:histidinol dehydrogenase [Chlorobiaceae bacterium]